MQQIRYAILTWKLKRQTSYIQKEKVIIFHKSVTVHCRNLLNRKIQIFLLQSCSNNILFIIVLFLLLPGGYCACCCAGVLFVVWVSVSDFLEVVAVSVVLHVDVSPVSAKGYRKKTWKWPYYYSQKYVKTYLLLFAKKHENAIIICCKKHENTLLLHYSLCTYTKLLLSITICKFSIPMINPTMHKCASANLFSIDCHWGIMLAWHCRLCIVQCNMF